MTLVDGPGFTCKDESGQNNCIVYLEFGVQTESSLYADTFPEALDNYYLRM